MIQVQHLTRRYGDLTAVKDVSFEIGHGEVVGLLGHNGAGKTTIMKMMTGYLEPTGGTVKIADLTLGPDTRAIQKRIGYLPENCPVWPEMAVIDYLSFQAALHDIPEERRDKAIATAIRRADLKAKAADSIQTLSRGYRQRVGVAQALLHEPDILILDEPTNGLDPTQIRQMRDLIRDLARSATVIVSTHILQEVQAVCERVLIMRAGELVIDARLKELQQSGGLLLSVGDDPRPHLEPLKEVQALTAVGDEPGRYHLDAPLACAPLVAEILTRAGIPLYALEPQRRDLEKVFAEVNEEATHE